MGLSEAQKHLIAGLMLFGIEKDAIVGIISALPFPEQLDEMMEWMCDHRDAKPEAIFRKVAEIRKNANVNEE